MEAEGRSRVVIRDVRPEVEGGRFAIKRIVGDEVVVNAVMFADGHDAMSCCLRFRRRNDSEWTEVEMSPSWSDDWYGRFTVETIGEYVYTLTGWIDTYKTWRGDLTKRIDAAQDISVYLPVGVGYLKAAAVHAEGADAARLLNAAARIAATADPAAAAAALDDTISLLMLRYAPRDHATTYRELRITVDPVRARYSTWYELFPRSCSPEPGRHGTFKDCARLVPEIAAMGFDILYLPPIHPIGITHRKGKNNSTVSVTGEPGSPWAIGSSEGGHKAIHAELGTLADFRKLTDVARNHGMDIALDLAYQCSPDHPYVKEHPEWFRRRSDGTIQFAENPPNKFEDIYPFDFETEHWESLWEELKSIVQFWIAQGVHVFRVDNPHTKPFAFWEWLIGSLKSEHPDLIFLAEAFTRPNLMNWLSKLGFTESYTYFTWRTGKAEIAEYFTELTKTDVREYFRPSLWPNTPDILHEYLQHGGRAAFMTRLVLAATLGASYGIYGPPYELIENTPRKPGSEEYLNSEIFEIKHRKFDDPRSLRAFITQVNRIRRENPSLHRNDRLMFHEVNNDRLICYSKGSAHDRSLIVAIVNLDFAYTQGGVVTLDMEQLGIDIHKPYRVMDLLTNRGFEWQGPSNYVELHPHEVPAHILRLD